jgi:hypothetical protein
MPLLPSPLLLSVAPLPVILSETSRPSLLRSSQSVALAPVYHTSMELQPTELKFVQRKSSFEIIQWEPFLALWYFNSAFIWPGSFPVSFTLGLTHTHTHTHSL